MHIGPDPHSWPGSLTVLSRPTKDDSQKQGWKQDSGYNQYMPSSYYFPAGALALLSCLALSACGLNSGVNPEVPYKDRQPVGGPSSSSAKTEQDGGGEAKSSNPSP
jgi:hypothetical protein